MEFVECKLKADKNNAHIEEMLALLKSSASDDIFVAAWLCKKGASLHLTGGFDDEGGPPVLCIVPRLNKEDLAEIYLATDVVKEAHREVREITEYFLEKKHTRIKIDNQRIEELEGKMGMSYHYDLCANFGSFDAIYHWALSYALSDGGFATLAHSDVERIFEEGDPEDTSLLEHPLFESHLFYQSPKECHGIVPGFGNYMYFQICMS